MKQMKHLAALMLTLCLLATLLPTIAFATTTASGTCGDNLTWTLDDAGTLTISGIGLMKNYNIANRSPWYDYIDSVKKVIIETGVTSIGNSAFYSCTQMKEITIPRSVTNIGNDAFYWCTGLPDITIPSSVTTIGDSSFAYCVALTKVTIPEGVTSIGEMAFSCCYGLKSITFPETVTIISDGMFMECPNLTDVSIPESVTVIGEDAFYKCTGLKKVIIPDSVTSIGSSAFNQCTSLQSITIGKGVTCIGNRAFYSCDSLKDIYITDPNAWCKIDFRNPTSNPAFVGEYLHILNVDGSEVTEVILDDTVTKIIDNTFYNCKSLQSIEIPDGITTIGNYAFYNCINLSTVSIGAGVSFMGSDIFRNCEKLTDIQIDKDNLYYSCDDAGVLFNKDKTTLIYPLKKLEGAYAIPAGVNFIENDAFLDCSGLVSLTIPDSVCSVGHSAFNNCTSLLNITIPNSVTSVGDCAFYNCIRLTCVYYCGTEEQREQINIDEWGNELFNDAKWHYDVTDIVLGSQIVHQCSCCDQYQYPDETENVFADINNNSWQISHAIYACQKGLMAGKGTDGDGKIKFDPNSPITREEFVQVLYNAEDKPSVSIANKFPDVKDAWYKSAVLWANSQNIANGMGNGSFGVGKNITRQDLAMMLYKYAKLKGYSLDAEDGKIDQFADGGKVADYAKTAMNWAVTNSILSGKGEAGKPLSTFRLDPTGTATRAECAAMLKNFMTAFGL